MVNLYIAFVFERDISRIPPREDGFTRQSMQGKIRRKYFETIGS